MLDFPVRVLVKLRNGSQKKRVEKTIYKPFPQAIVIETLILFFVAASDIGALGLRVVYLVPLQCTPPRNETIIPHLSGARVGSEDSFSPAFSPVRERGFMYRAEISAVEAPARDGDEPVIVLGEDDRGRIWEEFAVPRIAGGNDHGSGAVIDEQAIVPERDHISRNRPYFLEHLLISAYITALDFKLDARIVNP
jgi:hypothetical protein